VGPLLALGRAEKLLDDSASAPCNFPLETSQLDGIDTRANNHGAYYPTPSTIVS
jgi:hypothetical protein